MSKKRTAEDLENELADAALAEAKAQYEIAKVLHAVEAGSRERILHAVGHVLIADSKVPGVLAAFLRGANTSRDA